MSKSQSDDDTQSSSSVPAADAPPVQEAAAPTQQKPKKQYRQIQMPTAEQMVQEDMMNNCAVRTVMSGVLGSGLGLVFGVVMGSMDAGVSSQHSTCLQLQGACCAQTRLHHCALVTSWLYLAGGWVGREFGPKCSSAEADNTPSS